MFGKITRLQKNIITATLLVLMAVLFTLPFVLEYTLADDPMGPDRTAVYNKGQIEWKGGPETDDMSAATLGIFGETRPGDDYPLIHPGSGGTYRLRFLNDSYERIYCYMYVYCENPYGIPLQFDLQEDNLGTKVIPEEEYPDFGENTTVLFALKDFLTGKRLSDFVLNWQWDPNHGDEKDTEFGVRAQDEDLTYTLKVMFAVEGFDRYNSLEARDGEDGDATKQHTRYIYGYDDGTFRPNNNITRAETAAILSRLVDASQLGRGGKGSFFDVPSSHWASDAIKLLGKGNIIKGYPDGSFGPGKTITRAEFAALCVRFVEETMGEKISPAKLDFSDLSESHWSYSTVAKAVGDGIVFGYDDGTFAPDSSITRAEAVTMVNRMLRRHADEEYVDKMTGDALFPDVRRPSYWAYYEIYEAAHTHLYRIENGKEKWLS